jgi:hypothetical protein
MHFRPGYRPDRCGSRCTLSWSLLSESFANRARRREEREKKPKRPEQNGRMIPDQNLQIQNENAVRIVSQKRATTTAEETSRKACAKTPSRTERTGRGSVEKKTGDGRASLLCLSLSLSLSLSPWVFPTAAPGQCFF